MGPPAKRELVARPAAGANPALSANPRWCNRQARLTLTQQVEVRILGGEPKTKRPQCREAARHPTKTKKSRRSTIASVTAPMAHRIATQVHET